MNLPPTTATSWGLGVWDFTIQILEGQIQSRKPGPHPQDIGSVPHSKFGWQPKVSPDIAKCPLGRNCPVLGITALHSNSFFVLFCFMF